MHEELCVSRWEGLRNLTVHPSPRKCGLAEDVNAENRLPADRLRMSDAESSASVSETEVRSKYNSARARCALAPLADILPLPRGLSPPRPSAVTTAKQQLEQGEDL